MGIAEIVTATLAVMGGITGGSAITGAVMGSHRKIGAVKGFFWGLMLPLLGIGRVIISDKLKAPSSPVQEKDRTQNRGTAQEAARQQFSENHPQTQAETSRVVPVHREKQQQQQTQSHGRSI